MKQTKRILAWILALTLLLGMLPSLTSTVRAAETEAMEPTQEETAPATTEEIVPETTEAVTPETTETTEATVPETTEATVPETTEETIPEVKEVAARDEMLAAEASDEPEVEEMYLGQSKTITLADGEFARFSFTAEVSGEYVVHMPIDVNLNNFFLLTYDEKLDVYGMDVDNGIYFGRSFYLEAGEKCYFDLINSRVHKELTGTVRVDPVVNPSKISIVDVTNTEYNSPCPGNVMTFAIRPVPETAYFGNAEWASSDESVLEFWGTEAQCNAEVSFYAVGTGTATITVTTYSGLTASLDYEIGYEILDLDIPSYGEITARVDCSIQKFKGVKVNGEELDAKYYTVAEGSTIVTLHEDYLNALPEGDYEVTLQFTDGQSKFQFSVTPDDPGDLNGDGKVNTDDALHLVLNLSFADRFPLHGDGDLNSDGRVNTDDALHLVLHLSFPDRFPLYP